MAVAQIDISQDIIKSVGNVFNPLFERIRIFGTVDEPLFVANDVEMVLHLGDLNVRHRPSFQPNIHYTRITIPTDAGKREAIALTEHGLYKALFASDAPVAEQYCRFIVIVMRQLRTRGVVTLRSAITELQTENLRLKDTNRMLDDLTDRLKYERDEAHDTLDRARAYTAKLENRTHTAEHVAESVENQLRRYNVEYVELLERAVMKPVYVHVTGISEDEADDLADGEVYPFRLSTKPGLARHIRVAELFMVNPTKQIVQLGADHETCLQDLRELIDDSNLKYLKTM